MRKSSLIIALLLTEIACVAPKRAIAQGAAIIGQVVQPQYAAPNSTVRVCPFTGSGNPCSPLSQLFADPALTSPVSNPFTSDQFGNFSFYAPAGYFLVQVTPIVGTTYSYVASSNGNASVSSVGLSMPAALFNVTGSPIINSGTLNVSLNPQPANQVFGNCTNFTALPTFCSLTAAMIPSTLPNLVITGNLTVAGITNLTTANVATTLNVPGISNLSTLNVSVTSNLNSLNASGLTTLSGGLTFGGQTVTSLKGTVGTALATTASASWTNGDLLAANATSDITDSGVLASNVPLLNAANTFSALNTFNIVNLTTGLELSGSLGVAGSPLISLGTSTGYASPNILGQALLNAITPGTGAGTGGTANCGFVATCRDIGGLITVNVGTSPAGSGATIFTLTFGATHTKNACTFSPGDTASSNAPAIFMAGWSGSSVNLVITSSALTGSATYNWNYTCSFE